MRGIVCRSLRLELVAGLGIALAMPALAASAESTQALATQTTLAAETRDHAGRTQATLNVAVTGEDGQPATGTVAIEDFGKPQGGAVLNVEGKASLALSLAAGDHQLRAMYTGDDTHQRSVSPLEQVRAQTTGTPDFQISISPATLSLTPGQSGIVIASVTPENSSALTGPMFVTLSCSGFPDESGCTFTPENVEILVNATSPVTSSMVFQTQAASQLTGKLATRPGSAPIAWALVLPGSLGLLGLAWGGRRRRWLSRLSLLALVGLVTTLGTTGCNPRYNYLNHGPPLNPGTPAGSYAVHVTAQYSNGVTAIARSTTLALTVK